MPGIFTSYSRKDLDYAMKLKDWLVGQGFDVWIDQERIEIGRKWRREIEIAIKDCDIFLLIMSPDSETSEYVEEEIDFARTLKKPILPILIRGDHWTRMGISSVQQVDLRHNRLPEPDFYHTLIQYVNGEKPTASYESRRKLSPFLLAFLFVFGSGLVVILVVGSFVISDLLSPIPPTDEVAIPTAESVTSEVVSTIRPATDYTFALTPITTNANWAAIANVFDHGIEMVLVPAGDYMMGSSDEEIEQARQLCLSIPGTGECDLWQYQQEKPQHPQQMYPFWIDRYEVTREKYNACVSSGICSTTVENEYSSDQNHPINMVTWEQAKTFCEDWRGLRLPTEAEWEYAARGPSGWFYPWGNQFIGVNLNFCDRSCQEEWATTDSDGYRFTAPVGSYASGVSWVGAYDMSGNVWEWTSSLLRDYPYAYSDWHEDPADDDVRVIRGGSLRVDASQARTSVRFWLDQSLPGRAVGFRCVRPFDH